MGVRELTPCLISNLLNFREHGYSIDLYLSMPVYREVLLDCSLTVKAATLIFISGCGSAIPSAKQEKSGFIYNFV